MLASSTFSPRPTPHDEFEETNSDSTSDSDADTSFTQPVLNHQYFLPEPFQMSHCPWCPPMSSDHTPEDTVSYTDLDMYLAHLKTTHAYTVFQPLQVASVLEPYLTHYSHRIVQSSLHAPHDTEKTVPLGDPTAYPDDPALRQRLFQNRLEQVLAVQAHERETEGKTPRQCLFCKVVPENRALLFRHMFAAHNFNIGNPENMVYVSHFLDLLSMELAALRCLYCAHTFKNARTLRAHMRKKNHFRIPSSAVRYDRFYLINYLEPGKNWEALLSEPECNESDNESSERWSDWEEHPPLHLSNTHEEEVEKMELEEPSQCVWCDTVHSTAAQCATHMRTAHAFDIVALARACADDHTAIRWVNYLRHARLHGQCPVYGDACAATDLHVACVKPHLPTACTGAPAAARPRPTQTAVVSVPPLDYRALYETARELAAHIPLPLQKQHPPKLQFAAPTAAAADGRDDAHMTTTTTTTHADTSKASDTDHTQAERPAWEDPQFLLPILDADPLIAYVLQFTQDDEEDDENIEDNKAGEHVRRRLEGVEI